MKDNLYSMLQLSRTLFYTTYDQIAGQCEDIDLSKPSPVLGGQTYYGSLWSAKIFFERLMKGEYILFPRPFLLLRSLLLPLHFKSVHSIGPWLEAVDGSPWVWPYQNGAPLPWKRNPILAFPEASLMSTPHGGVQALPLTSLRQLS